MLSPTADFRRGLLLGILGSAVIATVGYLVGYQRGSRSSAGGLASASSAPNAPAAPVRKYYIEQRPAAVGVNLPPPGAGAPFPPSDGAGSPPSPSPKGRSVPEFEDFVIPEKAVSVTQDERGLLVITNTDPKLTDQELQIDAVRADGVVVKYVIMVPAPASSR